MKTAVVRANRCNGSCPALKYCRAWIWLSMTVVPTSPGLSILSADTAEVKFKVRQRWEKGLHETVFLSLCQISMSRNRQQMREDIGVTWGIETTEELGEGGRHTREDQPWAGGCCPCSTCMQKGWRHSCFGIFFQRWKKFIFAFYDLISKKEMDLSNKENWRLMKTEKVRFLFESPTVTSLWRSTVSSNAVDQYTGWEHGRLHHMVSVWHLPETLFPHLDYYFQFISESPQRSVLFLTPSDH